MFFIKGVNTIKGAMCGKVKMIFQGLHVACWFVLPNFAFLTPNLQLYARLKNHLLHFDPKSYILCIHALYHIKMNNLC
jgi:hypothetical protein